MKKRLLSCAKGGSVTALVLACLLTSFPQQAKAIFGFGDVVFDPSTWAETVAIWNQNVTTFQKVVEEVQWATKTYNQAVTQYNLLMAQAKNFDAMAKSGWRTAIPRLMNNVTPNRFGETALWPAALNGMPGLASGAWTSATLAVAHPAFMHNQQPGPNISLASLASVNAVDGASVQCMQTLGQYWQTSNANQASIVGLQSANADDSAATNSQVEQLNLINASNGQIGNELRAQSGIAACLAQQQMLANKIQRDQIASALNFQGEVRDLNAVSDWNWGGSADTITNYRPQ